MEFTDKREDVIATAPRVIEVSEKSPDTPRVAVVGLGYVGLPLAKRLSDQGLPVVGIDVDPWVVNTLNAGLSILKSISSESVATMRRRGFSATTNFAAVEEVDVIVVCVPTPLTEDRQPDLRAVISAVESLMPHLRKGQLVSLESTSWPGTTREVVAPIIATSGLVVGETVFLTFSPEREDPGNAHFALQNTPKLVGGVTSQCLARGVNFYRHFVDTVVPVSSPDVAEMAKVVENTYRFVNISLVNELKIVADQLGLDIFEIMEAAGTKPFGFAKFNAGPGIGGHCIPVDPLYLSWRAQTLGLDVRFIALSAQVNSEMPFHVLKKTKLALNAKGKVLLGARVHVLGVAYKPDIDDVRESPSITVLRLLAEEGALVSYSDPLVPELHATHSPNGSRMRSVELTTDVISSCDVVLLLCDHSDFDYPTLVEHAPVIVDTRGRYPAQAPKIIRA